MPFVIVKSIIKDFNVWKKSFSEDAESRKEAGAKICEYSQQWGIKMKYMFLVNSKA
ncbi:hypothetical protein LCGC14_1044430 [marine sediment metagenome]|uniref:Uncharacterized protein n=1 Tax=marine sediment metagenome TaxID=412755 RepID=A0A0F9NCG8_9ZZZZ